MEHDDRAAVKPPAKAFILYGPTESILRDVCRLLDLASSLDAVVLGRELGRAEAVIERFACPEDPESVVIAILTADTSDGNGSSSNRAAGAWPDQDVIFCLGYMAALVGPTRTIVLRQEGVNGPKLPDGASLLRIEDSGWRRTLAICLRTLGASVDEDVLGY